MSSLPAPPPVLAAWPSGSPPAGPRQLIQVSSAPRSPKSASVFTKAWQRPGGDPRGEACRSTQRLSARGLTRWGARPKIAPMQGEAGEAVCGLLHGPTATCMVWEMFGDGATWSGPQVEGGCRAQPPSARLPKSLLASQLYFPTRHAPLWYHKHSRLPSPRRSITSNTRPKVAVCFSYPWNTACRSALIIGSPSFDMHWCKSTRRRHIPMSPSGPGCTPACRSLACHLL